MNIGKGIVEIRKWRELKQKDLAKKAGISITGMVQIEHGNSHPTKKTMAKICGALGVPISYLMFFSIEEEDIKPEAIKTFRVLSRSMKELLMSDD